MMIIETLDRSTINFL